MFQTRPPKIVYSDEAFARLSDKFKIPENLRGELRNQLEDTAAVWRMNGGGKMPPRRASLTRKELHDIARLTKRLRAALSSISYEAGQLLNRQDSSYIIRAHKRDNPEDGPQYPALAYPVAFGESGLIILDVADMVKILDGLEIVASEAAETMRHSSVGKRRDHALRMWIINIEMIWRELLVRPFTRDVKDPGEPISEAARFCVAAFKAVDPDMPPSRVLNEMKLNIKKTH